MLTQIRNKMQDRKGFTLIELMIVIAILGVLAAVAIPFYNQYIENSKMRIARSNYEAAVRTVKAEFANVTAQNIPTTNLVAVLNDLDTSVTPNIARNKNPFTPAQDAFLLDAANTNTNRGQVNVSRTDFTGLVTTNQVTVSVELGATAGANTLTQTLTFQ